MNLQEFIKWHDEQAREYPRFFRHNAAMRKVTYHIGDTGEEVEAAFHGMWMSADRKDHCVGLIVLFADRFWLVPDGYETGPCRFRETPYSAFRTVRKLNPDADDNPNSFNLDFGEGKFYLSVGHHETAPDEAFEAFDRHI